MTTPIGHQSIAAYAKSTAAWGSGAPMQLGASDGFEFNSESLKANSAKIPNEGNYGGAYRRAGVFGALKPGGSIDFDLFYQCASWRLIAQALGGAAVTGPSPAGVYTHDLSILNNHAGIHGTLAIPIGSVPEGIKEIPFAKVKGISLEWDAEGNGKASAELIGFDEYFNVGSPDDDFAVASVSASATALTVLAVALADFTPTPLTMTKVVGITAINVTFVYLDRFGVQKTQTITETDFVSELWRSKDYASRVISVTINSLTGTGNVKVGISNGKNNASTYTAITTATPRDQVLFSQARFYATAQSGADFAAADEYYLSKLKIAIDLGYDQRVTTEFGYRITEPSTGGAGRPSVKVGLNYSALTSANKARFFDMIAKNKIKAKVVFTGPLIGATAVAHSLTIWLNAMQCDDGEGNVGGSGLIGFEQNAEAQQAAAVPTGFPSGVDEPIYMRLVNGLATAII